MDYKALDSNMTYDCRIETGSVEESERVCDWFRSHGHRVMRPWALRDYVIIRGSSYKLGSILEHNFPELAYSLTLISEPIGLERGEWVVIPSRGIVGQVAWEYGYNGRQDDENTRTGANVTVGSSTWSCGWASNLIRVRDLEPELADRLLALGKLEANAWEAIHRGEEWTRAYMEEVHRLTRELVPA